MSRVPIFLLLLLFFHSIPLTNAYGNGETDSLLLVVQKEKSPVDVIRALQKLADINRDRPSEVYYLTSMLDRSMAVDSVALVYDALSGLSRHYYNLANMDSLTYWTKYLDSVSEANKDNPDAYYDAHSYISKQFLFIDNYELSIDEAVRLHNKAKATGQVYGRICSAETLGTIYQAIGRDSLALTSFQDALNLLEQTNGDLQYRIYILSNMVRVALHAKQLDAAFLYWSKYSRCVSLQEEENQKRGIVNRSNWHRWMSYSYGVDYYLQAGDVEHAKHYLDLSEKYASEINRGDRFNIAVFLFFNAQILYYDQVGSYQAALNATDSILEKYEDATISKHRIKILTAMKRYEAAAHDYKQLLQANVETNKNVFVKQIEQLRTLHQVHDVTMQMREIEISNIGIKRNQHLLTLSICVFFALLVFIQVLLLLLRRSRKLKKELEVEKQSLVDSQEALYKAKQKAENASQMKSAFIANITHEIRTPLNAIVGFSSLVVDPSCDEAERKEYTDIIQNNSDLLLNLVNDVLDLSHMESGKLVVSRQPCNLSDCCHDVMKSVEHRAHAGVRLSFTPCDETYELHTDSMRLKQILINLLTNALKFTKQGEVNLSVFIGNEWVRFEVTDTGIGIPLEKQDHVFDRFFKLDEYVQGAGLGLAICRMIVDQLGGTISVDPTYTEGARFIFVHPSDFSPTN